MEELYTPVEAAKLLKVTKAAIYKWIKEGRLAVVYVGSDRRITRGAIEAFIAASTAEAAEKMSRSDNDDIGKSDYNPPNAQTPGRAAQLELTPA